MSLPPERISIKRRRQDEPVETLILDPSLARDKKRLFTDFYFQRLRHDQPTGPVLNTYGTNAVPTAVVSNAARDYTNLGIPTVKTSAPGDEVKDFAKYKTSQIQETGKSNESNLVDVAYEDSSLLHKKHETVSSHSLTAPNRRFHLMRDLSSTVQPNQAASTWRPKASLRPPLATFMEQHRDKDGLVHLQPPIDRIVELKTGQVATAAEEPPTEGSISNKTIVNTFSQSTISATKWGSSIRDDPTTWNLESDQLANELAALAFDIDPADAGEPPLVVPVPELSNVQLVNEPVVTTIDNDFIFETYIRVKHDPDVGMSNTQQNTVVGVLVIDDVNEDLWEKYIHSDDDDDDWDEEDEDSNAEDNPRNDYPDDEVSSDDEYGRNVYRYRQNASDDEQYEEGREA